MSASSLRVLHRALPASQRGNRLRLLAALRLLRWLLGRVAMSAPCFTNLAMAAAWRCEQLERSERDRAWAREWQREEKP